MKWFLLFLFLFASFIANTQSSPLNFISDAVNLCVASDESLSLTSRMGEVGISLSASTAWRRADVAKKKFDFNCILERPCFFNKDTGFVCGDIAKADNKYNIIYHTIDGGLNWKPIDFGQDGHVDDVCQLDDGQAWMSVNNKGIAYTSDYGLSWQTLNYPVAQQRFASIFFNTKREGIAGSLWNTIAYTDNNCQSWKMLATPLDQMKYNKTNRESRPAINRVAIFKQYLIVTQENLVFYSRRDTIDWTWLPNYKDFYTDADNSSLFFKTNKGKMVRCNSNFTVTHIFEITPGYLYDAKCKNGNLFILADNRMIKLDASNNIVNNPLAISDTTVAHPRLIGYTAENALGILGNKIFVQKIFTDNWNFIYRLPIPENSGVISLYNGSQLLYDNGNDSLLYFSLQGKLENRLSRSTMLADFGKPGIKQLIFNNGSKGCFYYSSDKLIYTNLGDGFGNPKETNTHGKMFNSESHKGMPEYDPIIEAADVQAFAEKTPSLFDASAMAGIRDLAFTNEEYQQCKNEILAFEASLKKENTKEPTRFTFYQNNIDFDRLLKLVDSIQYIDSKTLTQSLMHLSTFYSTSSAWKKIELINNNNEVLTIYSSYCEANAFYFPWVVSYKGYSFTTTNIEINKFIEKVYPLFLKKADRIPVLHSIVKNLY